MCFAVTDPASFENIQENWVPEIKHFLPRVPIMLVGNKIDLRKDAHVLEKLAKENKTPVETHEGHDMAVKIGAHSYMECSAKTGTGINEVFQEAIKVGLESSMRRRKKGKKCRVS